MSEVTVIQDKWGFQICLGFDKATLNVNNIEDLLNIHKAITEIIKDTIIDVDSITDKDLLNAVIYYKDSITKKKPKTRLQFSTKKTKLKLVKALIAILCFVLLVFLIVICTYLHVYK